MKRLTPLILIIISLAAFFFYVQPEYKKIQAYRQEAAEFDEVITKAEELKGLRAELADKIRSFSPADLEKLSVLIPDRVDEARLITDVSEVASRYGIRIDGVEAMGASAISQDAVSSNKPYKTTTTGFRFKAPYETALLFLKDIERSLRILDVTKMNISIGDGKTPIFDFSVTVRSYWIDGNAIKNPTVKQ